MPQRALNVALAILGLVALAALAVAGADAYAHARRGPRWWRRIVGAGLALVAILGVGGCRKKPLGPMCYSPGPPPVAEQTTLDLYQRVAILDEFASAETLDREATLVVLETIEDKLAVLSDEAALAELRPEELARARAVRNEVRAKIEAIREKLGPAPAPGKAPAEDRTEGRPDASGSPEPAGAEAPKAPSAAPPAEASAPAAAPEDQDASAVAAKDLEATDEWQRLVKVWREAEEIASGKRGDYPFDEAGKKRVLESLGRAARDLDALAKAELLGVPEAGLLKADLGTLTEGVQMKRPTELRNATCYKPMMIVPARESLKRLKARMPLLEALAAKGVVRNEVVRRVLARVARDLVTLVADKDALARISDAERAEAEEVSRAALRLLEKLTPRVPLMCYVLEEVPARGEPDASIIRRRMELLAIFVGEAGLGGEAAGIALRSAEADLKALEGGRT